MRLMLLRWMALAAAAGLIGSARNDGNWWIILALPLASLHGLLIGLGATRTPPP